jgi:fluoroquinolone resistance protein
MTQANFLTQLTDGAIIHNMTLHDADLSGTQAYVVVLRDCTFLNVNFAHADWEGVQAENCVFHRCRLVGMGLDTAVFTNCQFFDAENSAGCDFQQAKLRHARFHKCNLAMCSFEEAQLLQITIHDCHAVGAIFFRADFKGAATLTKNNLQYANLRGAQLAKCDLSHNNFVWANLDEANLAEANLMGCDLNGITYRYTKFLGADLRGAELIAINLREADLRGVKIFDSQMRQLIETCEIIIFPDNK